MSTVRSGRDLTAALARAAAGDTLVLEPGDYRGAWRVPVPLTLRADRSRGWPSLRPGGPAPLLTVDADGPVVLEGLDLEGGLALRAAAIRLRRGALTLRGCRLLGNRALKEGGALYVDGGASVLVEGCFFERNRALAGGGLYLAPGATGEVRDSGFTANRARCGGGLAIDGATCAVSASFFQDNEARYNGAAIAIRGPSRLDVADCTIGHSRRSPGIVREGDAPDVRVRDTFSYADGPGDGRVLREEEGRSTVWVAPASRWRG